jgi:hypothetical protein
MADLYHDQVSLLIHADGSDNGTYFKDSSLKNNTLTRASTITKTGVYKYGGSSAYFDGINAILYTGTGALNLGTSDFTIEFWMYVINGGHGGSYSRIIATAADGTSGGLYITTTGLDNPTRILVQYYDTAYRTVAISTNIIPNNTWLHIALCRIGTTWKLFIDGVQESLYTDLNPNLITTLCYIGNNSSQTSSFYGYLDEIRVTEGIARYTDSFTPPITAFSNVSNDAIDLYYDQVVLLLHCNGADGRNTIIDRKAHRIIATQQTQTKTSIKKFGTASVYFDGNGDYLSSDLSRDFDLSSTTRWSIEFWFYPVSVANSPHVLQLGYGASNRFTIYIAASKLALFTANSTANQNVRIFGSTTLSINQWYHVVIDRYDNVVRMWLNGQPEGNSFVWSSSYLGSSTYNIYLGWNYPSGTYSDYFNGYVDDVRITKGYARNSSNYNIQSELFPNDSSDPYWNNVSLLMHMEDANLTLDQKGHTITNTGATRSNTQKKFESYSAYFDGGDYEVISSNVDFAFGSSSFCIELWLYPQSTANNYPGIIGRDMRGSWVTNEWSLVADHASAAGKYSFWAYNYSSTFPMLTSNTLVYNVWTHIVIVRSGNTWAMIINGILESILVSSVALTGSSSEQLMIGNQFLGYIDELRVTKGSAREYTFSINTPTEAYPDSKDESYDPYWSSVALLMHMDGDFIDAKGHTIAPQGNTTTNLSIYKYGTASAQFDSNGDYLLLPTSTDFAIGLGDFTIEFWGRLTAITSHRRAFVFCGTNGPRLMTTGVNQPYTTILGGNVINTSSVTASTGVWRHFAFVRGGGQCRLYIDGLGTTWVANSTNVAIADSSYIGSDGTGITSMCWEGNIDDFRFTKGICRYNTDFIPPTIAFAHEYAIRNYFSIDLKQSWLLENYGNFITDTYLDQNYNLLIIDQFKDHQLNKSYKLLTADQIKNQDLDQEYVLSVYPFKDVEITQNYNLNVFDRFKEWILKQNYKLPIIDNFKDVEINQSYLINVFDRFKESIVSQNYNLNVFDRFKDWILKQDYTLNVINRFNNLVASQTYLLNAFDKFKDRILEQNYNLNVISNLYLNIKQDYTLEVFNKFKDWVLKQEYTLNIFGNNIKNLDINQYYILNVYSDNIDYLNLKQNWIISTFDKINNLNIKQDYKINVFGDDSNYFNLKQHWLIEVDFDPIIKYGTSFDKWINPGYIIEKDVYTDPFRTSNLADLIKFDNILNGLETDINIEPNVQYYFKIWLYVPKRKNTKIIFQIKQENNFELINDNYNNLLNNEWVLCNWEFITPSNLDINLQTKLIIFADDEIVLYGAWLDTDNNDFLDKIIYEHEAPFIDSTLNFSNYFIEQLDDDGNQLITRINSSKPKININTQWTPIANIKVRRSSNWSLSPFYIIKYKIDNEWL